MSEPTIRSRLSEAAQDPFSPARTDLLPVRKELLTVNDLRQIYGLGRDLATALIRLLPHIKVGASGCGERLMVRRQNLDRLLEASSKTKLSLWEIARNLTPDSLQAWLLESEAKAAESGEQK